MSKTKWEVKPGHYPGFIEIEGASFRVSIVLSATDLTFNDAIRRTDDAHMMAAAPELYEALRLLSNEVYKSGNGDATDYGWPEALRLSKLALAKARGES